jgi:hypothetical protein
MDKKQGIEYIQGYLSDPENTLTRKEIVDILSDPEGKYGVPEKTAYRWFKSAKEENDWMFPKKHTDKATEDKELSISTVRDLLNVAITNGEDDKAIKLSSELLKLHKLARSF